MKGLITAFFFLAMFASCAKNDDLLPNLPVNFSAPLTDPRLSRLTTPGGAVTINGQGVAGLIIYRKPDGGYVAYDRCSTVEPNKRCAVELDDPALTATDPCSGAKFSLLDGSPAKAPAVQSLKQYNVSIAGNTLMINN